ncbi:hypothetical protein BESB_012570 [Besnoitia besnoiti]|uniref:guanylate cyclase n=1 Tax=Besnoitia besnoiti TaxID=94643 RepID=A0A2A9M3W3_BESBE|nr:hypothetical protein BESB_012570 [Besnoitia besnoiti]PFH32645.1 hypothetical protein BESB_012570 [Besnoitia besnoiti]
MPHTAKGKQARSPGGDAQRARSRAHEDHRGRGRGDHGASGAGGRGESTGSQSAKSTEKGRGSKHQPTQKQMSFLQGKHQQRVGNVVSRLGPAAVGQTTLMDKKRKLYSDTSQQPLWSLRKITINPTDKDDLRRFPSNAIFTHRYSCLTFVFKNLWEQFHRVINWWFLLMTIIQAIPQLHYNPNHVWSTALPFAIVLVFGMVKDAFTDLGRRQRDRMLNQRVCCIVDGHTPQLRLLKWESVRVGNILRLTDGEEVPADIVVLATSNSDGVAYVETSKLDGETNLKFKQGVKETRGESSPLSIAGIRGRVVCEKPCAVMDAFTGSLKLDAHPRATPSTSSTSFSEPWTVLTSAFSARGGLPFLASPCCLGRFHLRALPAAAAVRRCVQPLSSALRAGSHIRNTEWLYGVVIYTGDDTRIQKNAAPPGFKRPHIEKDINTYLFISFFVVFLTILISVMSKWSVQERDSGDTTVAEPSPPSSGTSGTEPTQSYGSSVEFMLGSRDLLQNPWMSILRFLAIYAPILPLSLPLMLDVVYLLQSVLIEGDIHIRGGGRPTSSGGPSTASTSSLVIPEDGALLLDGEGSPTDLAHAPSHRQTHLSVADGLGRTRRFLSQKFSAPFSKRLFGSQRGSTPREGGEEDHALAKKSLSLNAKATRSQESTKSVLLPEGRPEDGEESRETNGENVPSFGGVALPDATGAGREDCERAEETGLLPHGAMKSRRESFHAATPVAGGLRTPAGVEDEEEQRLLSAAADNLPSTGPKGAAEDDKKSQGGFSRYSDVGTEKMASLSPSAHGTTRGVGIGSPLLKAPADAALGESAWTNPHMHHFNTRGMLFTTVGGPGSWRSAGSEREDVWAEVHTPALNPNLGQVDFIFTDKTGTITENDMTFSMCSVAGKIYGMTSCGAFDRGDSSEYGSRVWTVAETPMRGSRDRLLAPHAQRQASVTAASPASRSFAASCIPDGLGKRAPSLRLRTNSQRGSRHSLVSRTGHEGEAKDKVPAAGASPTSHDSCRLSASLSLESHREEGEDDEGPSGRENAKTSVVASHGSPLARRDDGRAMVTEGVHGVAHRRRFSGMCKEPQENGVRRSASASLQSSRGGSENEQSEAGTESEAGRRGGGGKRSKERERKRVRPREVSPRTSQDEDTNSDRDNNYPIRCIRSFGDGAAPRGRAISTSPRAPLHSASSLGGPTRAISKLFSRTDGEMDRLLKREGGDDRYNNRHIAFADRGSPRSPTPESEGGVSLSSAEEGGPRSAPHGRGARRGSGSLYMPVVEEEDEGGVGRRRPQRLASGDSGGQATSPLSPAPSRGGVPFLYDEVDFPTGFRETPMEGQIRRNCDFYDASIFTDLARRDLRSHRIDEFIKCMAICNTVVPWVYTTHPAMPTDAGYPSGNFASTAYVPPGGGGFTTSVFSCSGFPGLQGAGTGGTGFTGGTGPQGAGAQEGGDEGDEEKGMSHLVLPSAVAHSPGGSRGVSRTSGFDGQLSPLMQPPGGCLPPSYVSLSPLAGGSPASAATHIGRHTTRRRTRANESGQSSPQNAKHFPPLSGDVLGAEADYVPCPSPVQSPVVSCRRESTGTSPGELRLEAAVPLRSSQPASPTAAQDAKGEDEAPSSPHCAFAPASLAPPSVLRAQTGAGLLKPSKSLARGVSFKEKHEEFPFSKDEETSSQEEVVSGGEDEGESVTGALLGADEEDDGLKGDDNEDDDKSRQARKNKSSRSASASLMSLKSRVTASSRDVADLLFRRGSRPPTSVDGDAGTSLSGRALGRPPSLERGPLAPPHGLSSVTAYCDGRNSLINIIKYQASSPDEECLVSAASHMGYTLVGRTSTSVTLNINGQERRWQVIGVNEFTQKRGRMSIVVRPQGWTEGSVLYVKGADVAMLDLLSSSFTRNCQDYRRSCSSLSRFGDGQWPGRGPSLQGLAARTRSGALMGVGGSPVGSPSGVGRLSQSSPVGQGSRGVRQDGFRSSSSLGRFAEHGSSRPPAISEHKELRTADDGAGRAGGESGDGEPEDARDPAGGARDSEGTSDDEGLRSVRADSMLRALNPGLYNYDKQHHRSAHMSRNTTALREAESCGSLAQMTRSAAAPAGDPGGRPTCHAASRAVDAGSRLSPTHAAAAGAERGGPGAEAGATRSVPPSPLHRTGAPGWFSCALDSPCMGPEDGYCAAFFDEDEDEMIALGDISLVEQHLKKFSLQGLRTMALACRYLTQEETETYTRLYTDACASVYCRAERLEEVAEDMERDLEYLGITGVRDKLQELVPETLQLMMEAGIRVWMVTGDNVEYALHICHSCRLLTSRTRIFHAALEFSGRKAKREGVMLYELFRKARRLKRRDEHICLVVTGPNLRTFLNHPDLQTYFLNMACCSDVVVAARVTPSQKAEMVRLVKKRLTPQPITLAIGDGGNDVAMLQEAHVGVAIRGHDSAAAIAAAYADYSFSEFRFLQRLLFVHGRLSLMRISTVILWSFFKSLCIGLPAFLFQPQAFWSAVEVYDPFLLMLVDFLWTTLPGIVHGYTDQDLPTHLLPCVPVLYTPGRRRLYFNGFRFILWTVEGIVYSFIIFYLLQATWMDGSTFGDGQVLGFHSYGILLLFSSLLQSNLRIILETNLWTPTFLFTTIFLCTLMFFPAVLLYSLTGWPRRYMELAGRVVFNWPMLYFLIPLWISIGILVQLLLQVFTSSLFPNISGSVKQYLAQKQADVDARRKSTKLPFSHPRPRLLPGGHDEYGWFCGMGSCWSLAKRVAWLVGGCFCVRTPRVTQDPLGSHEFGAELRERFNPLRHKSVADRLPPPRRFRINENFLSYTGAADEKAGEGAQREAGAKGAGAPAGGLAPSTAGGGTGRTKSVFGPGGAGGVMPMTDMAADLETENSLSSNGSDQEKAGDNNTKLVKVSHLINRFTLRFKDMQLEADYQIHNKKSFLKRLVPWYRVIFVLIALYELLSFLTEYFIDKHWNPRGSQMQPWMCLPTLVVGLGFVATVVCTFYDFIFLDHFSLIVNSIVFLMVTSNVVFYATSHVDGTLTSVLFPVFTFVILRISFLQAVVWNVLFLMITIARFVIDKSYLPTLSFVHYLPLFIGVDVFVGFVGYRLEYNQRKSFLLDYSVDASRRKQREILNTMLPAFVVDQMINSELNDEGIPTSLKAEDRGTVSVIFCDVYEFQQVVASIEPTRLVEVLDSLFLCFDRSAEQFGCTKIETVFETYLAAAGLQPGKEASPASSQQDACDALDMALAMLEVAAQIRYEVKTSNQGFLGGSASHGSGASLAGSHAAGSTDTPRGLPEHRHSLQQHPSTVAMGSPMSSRRFNRQKTGNVLRTVLQSRPQRIRVKIGIHSGRVISGVVGAKKPQYALFGDTVNTASRMKTTGQPGYIHISEDSYELVKGDDTLEYEPRHTEVKGKGLMNTFLLVRVKGSPYPHFDEQEGNGSTDGLSESGGHRGESRCSDASRRLSAGEPSADPENTRAVSRCLSDHSLAIDADPASPLETASQGPTASQPSSPVNDGFGGTQAETKAFFAAALQGEGEIVEEAVEQEAVDDIVAHATADVRRVRPSAGEETGQPDSARRERLFQSAEAHGAVRPQRRLSPLRLVCGGTGGGAADESQSRRDAGSESSDADVETVALPSSLASSSSGSLPPDSLRGSHGPGRFAFSSQSSFASLSSSSSACDSCSRCASWRSSGAYAPVQAQPPRASDSRFDYDAMSTRQLLRIYQRQQKVAKVMRWIDEELRGNKRYTDGDVQEKTLSAENGDAKAACGRTPVSGASEDSQDSDEARKARLLERIKRELRRQQQEETEAGSPGGAAASGAGQSVPGREKAPGTRSERTFRSEFVHGTPAPGGEMSREAHADEDGARDDPRTVEQARSASQMSDAGGANGQKVTLAHDAESGRERVPADATPLPRLTSRKTEPLVAATGGARPPAAKADNSPSKDSQKSAGFASFLFSPFRTRSSMENPSKVDVCPNAQTDRHVESKPPVASSDDEDLEQSRMTRISVSSEWLLLKFKDKNLEARYRTHFYNNKSNINTIEQALIIFLVTFCVQTLTRLALPRIYVVSPDKTLDLYVCTGLYWAVRATYTLAAFALWMLFHYRNRKEVASCLELRWMVFLLNLLFISASCVFALSNSWGVCARDDEDTYTYWLLSDTIELFFYIVILHHNTGLLFQNCILVDVLLMTMSLTFIITTAKETASTVSTIATFPCYVFFNLVSAYCKEYIDRLTFYVNEHAKTTESRATQLLNDMLPKQVLEEFQQDKLKLAYLHENVTFLFADICGFTSWAKGVDACEVVTMLQKLFAKFDKDSTKFGLYKLCTIGDAYVAVSEPVTAENQDTDPREGMWLVLEMAKAMISNILEVRERLCIPNLNMRIGLHYGSCVGGVIGSGRLRYDLWGMDVLTGNMMESNGVPGKINVSEILKTEIEKGFPGEFVFKFNKRVAVLQSTVDSYLIRPAKEFDEDEELAASVNIAGSLPGASMAAGGGQAQLQQATSNLRRDGTSLRGNYRRRFTILGNAPRVLGRRHSLKGSQPLSAVAFASQADLRVADEHRGHAEEDLQMRLTGILQREQTSQVGEEVQDGLRRLRDEIERAGGLGLDVSPSDVGSVAGSRKAGAKDKE